jgi:site-specific recombinase XerC
VALEARGLGSVSINVRITAVRKLAVEAADNGLLAPELANGIKRVKGVASKGVRLGNRLTAKHAQPLLNAPDITTTKGLRDRAMIAVLLGCGLRRSEVAALTFSHIQQLDGRWCIVDLVGKHGWVRTVPMPTWVKVRNRYMDGSRRHRGWTTCSGRSTAPYRAVQTRLGTEHLDEGRHRQNESQEHEVCFPHPPFQSGFHQPAQYEEIRSPHSAAHGTNCRVKLPSLPVKLLQMF